MATNGTAPGTVPRRAAEPAAPEPAVELLVHGVGGATAQEMLADPCTVRITGDTTASIHRRTSDAADRPFDGRPPVREAYTWSNLTSGNGARALWLLLLPFMVVNMAHWMRPATPAQHRAHRGYDILVRLIALSLTVLLIAGACAVALDLVAWQCAGSDRCAERATWLGPLAAQHGWWAQPGRRLALAAAVPALLTALLWWLSHRTWSAYESASPPVRSLPDGPGSPALSRPGFWYGRGLVCRLRAAHTAAGLLTVTGALLAVTRLHDRGPHGESALAALGWLLAALLAAGWTAVVYLVARDGRTEEVPDRQPMPRGATALSWAALALLLCAAAHAAWSRPEWTAGGGHPGHSVFVALTVVQGGLVIALAVTARHLHRCVPPADRGALAGLGGAAMALLGCTLAGVLTGGVAQRIADWLDPGAAAGEPRATIAGPPVLLSWQATAIPAVLLVAVGFAAVAVARVRRYRRRLAPQVPERYAGERGAPLPERSRRIASAIARAELTDATPGLVGWVTGTSLVLGLAVVAGSLTGRSPSDTAEVAPAPVAWTAELCQSLGSWLMGLGVVVLAAMGRRAYRDPAARRTVGILWDVGTFWPRAAHPFAPPCYAERAVPDLSWRMGTWIDATGGRLVISGHSQGSVLATAAVWQLDAATRSRVALLTYGSPLARLYGRWFPLYFGPSALAALHRAVPCWRNLWRDTDPIGGPVGVAGDGAPVDRRPLPDPRHYGRNLRCPLPEPVLGHGEYDQDPAYEEERAALFRALLRDPAAAVPEQPGPAERKG